MAKWQYCAIGNVIEFRTEENGAKIPGTKEFRKGAKLYLCGKYWDFTQDTIGVIGLGRNNRIRFVNLPVKYIEKVRLSKAFKPSVLRIMNDFEFENDWWKDTPEDRQDIIKFIGRWNTYRK